MKHVSNVNDLRLTQSAAGKKYQIRKVKIYIFSIDNIDSDKFVLKWWLKCVYQKKLGSEKSIDGNLYRPFFHFLSVSQHPACQHLSTFKSILFYKPKLSFSFFPQLTNDDDSPFTFTNVHFQLRRNFFFPKKILLSLAYHAIIIMKTSWPKQKKIYLQNWVSESEANLASWLTWELLPRALKWVSYVYSTYV